jgi:hypothetical protein
MVQLKKIEIGGTIYVVPQKSGLGFFVLPMINAEQYTHSHDT